MSKIIFITWILIGPYFDWDWLEKVVSNTFLCAINSLCIGISCDIRIIIKDFKNHIFLINNSNKKKERWSIMQFTNNFSTFHIPKKGWLISIIQRRKIYFWQCHQWYMKYLQSCAIILWQFSLWLNNFSLERLLLLVVFDKKFAHPENMFEIRVDIKQSRWWKEMSSRTWYVSFRLTSWIEVVCFHLSLLYAKVWEYRRCLDWIPLTLHTILVSDVLN